MLLARLDRGANGSLIGDVAGDAREAAMKFAIEQRRNGEARQILGAVLANSPSFALECSFV